MSMLCEIVRRARHTIASQEMQDNGKIFQGCQDRGQLPVKCAGQAYCAVIKSVGLGACFELMLLFSVGPLISSCY